MEQSTVSAVKHRIASDCFGRTYEFFDKVSILNELAAKNTDMTSSELYRRTNEIYSADQKNQSENKTA